jgi:hypothetical protein
MFSILWIFSWIFLGSVLSSVVSLCLSRFTLFCFVLKFKK